MEPVRTPESAAARVAEMTPEGQQAAMRVSVAQAMEGRIPDVEMISHADRQANLREFMAGSRVVTPDGEPLVVYRATKAEGEEDGIRFFSKNADYAEEYAATTKATNTVPAVLFAAPTSVKSVFPELWMA